MAVKLDAHQDIELAVRVGPNPRALTEILQAISDCGVDLLAYCSYHDRNELVTLLVTNQPSVAEEAIIARGYDCQTNSVVVVGASDQVGAVARLGAGLAAAGVEILYSYASSARATRFFAVFKTSNDAAAVEVLARMTNHHVG